MGLFPSLSRLRSRFPFPRCTEIAVNLNIISSVKEQRIGNIFRLVFTNKKKKTSVEYRRIYRKALLLVYNRLRERYRSPRRKGSEAVSHVLVIYFLHLLAFSPLSFGPHDRTTIHLFERKQVNAPNAPLSATLFVLSVFFTTTTSLYTSSSFFSSAIESRNQTFCRSSVINLLHRPLIFPV